MCVIYVSVLYTHNHNDINLTVHIHLQMQNSTKHRRLCCSGMNGLLITWLWFFDTKRETQFLKVFCNHTMLTTPPPNVRHISWSFRSQFVSAGRDQKNSTVCLNVRNPNYSTPWQRTQFSACMVQSQILNCNCLPQWQRSQLSAYMVQIQLQLPYFSKFSNSQPISSGHDIIHTPAHFLSGVYYDNSDCQILCSRV